MDVVRTLLHGSVPTINTLDEEGFAPLHYAARYDRATIVQLLINAGAGKVVHCYNLEANQLCFFWKSANLIGGGSLIVFYSLIDINRARASFKKKVFLILG